MTEYVIKYEYNSWLEGCGCCSDSSSELTIYEASREDAYTSSFPMDLIENEQELREWIRDWYPEYSDFVVHEDTRWWLG